ncbi:MAG: sugar phosphate isomerase/epimerase family protein [bacterium]
MQESLYKYIRPGIIHFMAFPSVMKGEGPILETLAKIANDDFFRVVEITWMKDKKVREEARKLIESSHLSVAFGAQPAVLLTPLNPNSLDRAERKKAVEVLKEQVDMAEEMGAKAMALLSGKDPGDSKRKDAMKALADTLKELCEYAKPKGMGITLEVFDRDIDKKALIGPTDSAVEIAKMVRGERENFGLMVDLSHLPLLRETPKQALKPVKDYLVHIHIGNAYMKDKNHPAYGDYHPRFGLPGGANDVPQVVEFLKTLMDIGYLDGKTQRVVSFEVKPLPDETSEAIIANAKRTLVDAWVQL